MWLRRCVAIFCCAGAASLASASAQSFFKPTPIYQTPAWRGTAGTEFSWWDVFYSPYNGINFPDMDAPNGSGDSASGAGFTPPANASPGDPFAFWHAANPTVQQVLDASAFIIAPSIAGNIYSPSGQTGYEVADATPFTLGTVVLQWQTDGQLVDFSTLRLVAAGGINLAPTNFITEYESSGSAFGGVTNRTAAQWNLTGLGVTSYTIEFQSEGTSTSLQELLLDTAPTYAEAVASARTWTAASGAWSAGANWSGGTVGPVGGNIVFASGTGATVDGGTREIGELKLNAPGGFTVAASGGGVLKVNAGITAAPASAASYTISAPYQIGSYNLMDIRTGATVTLAGPVSGAGGYLKLGPGTLRLTAANSFTGSVTITDGTLEVSGANSYTGTTSVGGGRLILLGHAPSGSAGTLGQASSAVVVGSGGSTGGPEAAVLIGGAFTVGRNFLLLNGTDAKKLGGQDTGAGAVFAGNVTLQSAASGVLLHAEDAGDVVTFSGGITGGGIGKTLTKTGAGTVVFSGGSKTYLNDTAVAEGTLRFEQSMTLRSLSIAAGASVVFSSGAPSFAGAAAVPEPGTLGLLLAAALGAGVRRRRAARNVCHTIL